MLHDVFAVSFEEIAPIVGRSAAATRQLASRARRRVQGTATTSDTEQNSQREIVDAFLAAARGGDFEALLTVLDPEIVFHADAAAVQAGGPETLQGATAVARLFAGRAQAAKSALVNGAVGVVVAPRGRLLLVLLPTIVNGKIVKIEAVADSEQLHKLDLAILND